MSGSRKALETAQKAEREGLMKKAVAWAIVARYRLCPGEEECETGVSRSPGGWLPRTDEQPKRMTTMTKTIQMSKITRAQDRAAAKIRVRYSSVDDQKGTRKSFSSIAGARKYAHEMIGAHPDLGRSYAVSLDGIGKIEVSGTSLANLFPETLPENPILRKTHKVVARKAAEAVKAPVVKEAVTIPARAGTNKEKLLALLTKNAGKPVSRVDMIKAVYGSPEGTGIEGVINGATIAAEKAGRKIVKEGHGKLATYTLR